jgi:hypothetical protein
MSHDRPDDGLVAAANTASMAQTSIMLHTNSIRDISRIIAIITEAAAPGETPAGGSVVISGFEDLDLIIVRSVDEPVLVVDPPGPVSGQFPLERFWFSNPCEGVALDFSDESGDPAGRLAVGG